MSEFLSRGGGLTIFNRIYEHSPIWLQTVGVNLYGLWWKWLRLGGDFDREVAGWRERESWSAGRIEDYQSSKLRELLKIAWEETEFYPRLWARAGIERSGLEKIDPAGLSRLPVVTRRTIRERPWELWRGGRKAGGVRRFVRSTSGTTGASLDVAFSPEVFRRLYAAVEARAYNWAGTSVRAPRSTIGARSIIPGNQRTPPFWRYNLAERHLYLSAFHVSPQNAADYCRAFNRYHPELMTGFSSSHYFLAQFLAAAGLEVHPPRAIVVGSDRCSPEMQERIEMVFGSRVSQMYGMVENCVLASSCEAGSLHVSPDFGIVEVLRGDGAPAGAGERGRIVVTGLANTTSLFVRYDTGDSGALSGRKCSCGRPALPLLEDFEGRVEDVVRTPEGRELVRLDRLFTGIQGLECAQVIQQQSDGLQLKLVARQEGRNNLELEIKRRAASMLGDMRLQFEYVDRIPLDPSGKFRPVVSLLERNGKTRRSR